ncbi:methylenetetrahydrofolate reductase [Geomonas silvestris]|uniref:Methylenetetrahydrofolate reductase n=1 Tax=Geomonas silvestris TaxID=2740184 RepID=A0A6V8MJY7_9BACT|nr:methylenetetrahydrofolate reductase [Geomonas silvestris]GFO60298.1 methylenetetrahydrofolate reductase [Geomonas silvestris]
MKIVDQMSQGKQFLSLEFFPPKDKNEWPHFFKVAQRLAELNPLFASVTYGAGGSSQGDTLEIVTRLKRDHGLESMAHLTCIGTERGALQQFLDELASAEVYNVLALRGDLPQDAGPEVSVCRSLSHASDLASFIRAAHPEMGIGVAGYPEAHPEATSPEDDLAFLKKKLELGGDFVITQLFFDNESYFDFVARARALGIQKPIIPGILPVVSLKVIRRIVSLCGASIPPEFLAKLEEADRAGGAAAVQKLGIAHARSQAAGLLAQGAPGVHLYTLNRDEAILDLVDGLLPGA